MNLFLSRRPIGYVLALLLLASLGACDQGGGAPVRQEQLEALEQDIRAVAGTEAERASQCRTCALGEKPCGGPASHLVYSTASTNEARLEILVARYNALSKRYNRENGLLSDCALVAPPDTALVEGQCSAAP